MKSAENIRTPTASTTPARESIPYWFGLDVSKESFAVSLYDSVSDRDIAPDDMFKCTAKGVKACLRWCRRQLEELGEPCDGEAADRFAQLCQFVSEVTGNYSRKLYELFVARIPEIRFSICNANTISCYCKAFSHNKTDKSDARLIARFGEHARPATYVMPSQEQLELRELLGTRRKLKEARAACANRLHTMTSRKAKRLLQEAMDAMKKSIDELEADCRRIVSEHKEMAHEVKLLTSIPWVGMITAMTLYAYYGSLKQYTPKQFSALSGLCPVVRQSGKCLNGSAMSKRGPKEVRGTMGINTSHFVQGIPAVEALYARLMARGKKKMTVGCACLRKVLTICRGVVVSDTPYDSTKGLPRMASDQAMAVTPSGKLPAANA